MQVSKKLSNKRKLYLILLLVILFSLFIRFYQLYSESIWLDEALSIYNSQHITGGFKKVHIRPVDYIFYDITLNLWITLFEMGEFATRSLSAIAGTLSVILIFLVGKAMFDERTGLYSAIILAVSPLNIYYSQEIKSYALLNFMILASFYFYHKYNIFKNKKHIVGYIISSLLMLYTNPIAIIIFIFQNVFHISTNLYKRNFPELKRWLIIIFIIMFFRLPKLILFAKAGPINQLSKFPNYVSWIPQPTTYTLKSAFIEFAGSEILLYFFILLIGILFLKPLFNLSKKRQIDYKNIILLLLWFLIPAMLFFLFSIFIIPLFHVRYILSSSLALYILMAVAISTISKNKLIQCIIILFIITTSFQLLNDQFSSVKKEQWRQTTEYIKENVKDDDYLILCRDSIIMPFSYYYANDCFTSSALRNCSKQYNIFSIDNILQLNKIPDLDNHPSWLILSHCQFVDKNNSILESLIKNKELTINNSEKYHNIQVYYFK